MRLIFSWVLIFQIVIGNSLAVERSIAQIRIPNNITIPSIRPLGNSEMEKEESDFRTRSVLFHDVGSAQGLSRNIAIDVLEALDKKDPSLTDKATRFIDMASRAKSVDELDRLSKQFPKEHEASKALIKGEQFSYWVAKSAFDDANTKSSLGLGEAASAAGIAAAAANGLTWSTGPGAALGAGALGYKAVDWMAAKSTEMDYEKYSKELFGKSTKELVNNYSMGSHMRDRHDRALTRAHESKSFGRVMDSFLPTIDGKQGIRHASEFEFRQFKGGYADRVASDRAIDALMKGDPIKERQFRIKIAENVKRVKAAGKDEQALKAGVVVEEQLAPAREAAQKAGEEVDQSKEEAKKIESLKNFNKEFDKYAGYARAGLGFARVLAGDNENIIKAIDIGCKVVDLASSAKDLVVAALAGGIAGGPVGIAAAGIGLAFKALGIFGGGDADISQHQRVMEQLASIRNELAKVQKAIQFAREEAAKGNEMLSEQILGVERLMIQRFAELESIIQSNHDADMKQHQLTQRMISKGNTLLLNAIVHGRVYPSQDSINKDIAHAANTFATLRPRKNGAGVKLSPDYVTHFRKSLVDAKVILFQHSSSPTFVGEVPSRDTLNKLKSVKGLSEQSILSRYLDSVAHSLAEFSNPEQNVCLRTNVFGPALACQGMDLSINQKVIPDIESQLSVDEQNVFAAPTLLLKGAMAAHGIFSVLNEPQNTEDPVCDIFKDIHDANDAHDVLNLAIDSLYQLIQKQKSMTPTTAFGRRSPLKFLKLAAEVERSYGHFVNAALGYKDAFLEDETLKGLDPYAPPRAPGAELRSGEKAFRIPPVLKTPLIANAEKISPCNDSMLSKLGDLPMDETSLGQQELSKNYLADIPESILAFSILKGRPIEMCYSLESDEDIKRRSVYEWEPFASDLVPGRAGLFTGLAKIQKAPIRVTLNYKIKLEDNDSSPTIFMQRTLESKQKANISIDFFEPVLKENNTSGRHEKYFAGETEGSNPAKFVAARDRNRSISQSFEGFGLILGPYDKFYQENNKERGARTPIDLEKLNVIERPNATPEETERRKFNAVKKIWSEDIEKGIFGPPVDASRLNEVAAYAHKVVTSELQNKKDAADSKFKRDIEDRTGAMWNVLGKVDTHVALLKHAAWHAVGELSEDDAKFSPEIVNFYSWLDKAADSNTLSASILPTDFTNNKLNSNAQVRLSRPLKELVMSMASMSGEGALGDKTVGKWRYEQQLRELLEDLMKFVKLEAMCKGDSKLQQASRSWTFGSPNRTEMIGKLSVDKGVLPQVVQKAFANRDTVTIREIEEFVSRPIEENRDSGIDPYDNVILNQVLRNTFKQNPELSVSDVDAIMRQISLGLSRDGKVYSDWNERMSEVKKWKRTAMDLASFITDLKKVAGNNNPEVSAPILAMFDGDLVTSTKEQRDAIVSNVAAEIAAGKSADSELWNWAGVLRERSSTVQPGGLALRN